MRNQDRVRARWIASLQKPGRIAQVLAVLVMGIADVALVGWVSKRWIFASLNPEYIPMAPSTALTLVALCCAILAVAGWPERRAVRRGARVTALVVSLATVLILAHALLNIGPDIENWLYRNPELFKGVPVGRMSPLTALAFLLSGLALLTLLDGRPAACEAAVGLSVGVCAIGLVAVVGYWYGAPLLYGGTLVPVALPSAAALTCLGLSLLAAIGKRSRLLRALTGPSVTARLLRAYIPAVALFALVHLWGDAVLAPGLGIREPMLRAALVSLGATAIFGGATALSTRRIGGALDRAEAGRQLAEAALRASEERYRTTLISIGDGVIATDAGGRVELINPVAEALTGWSQIAARGKPLAEVFQIVNEETGQPVEDLAARVLREGKLVGLANHTQLIARDGETHPIADSGAPIYNEKSELGGVVLVFRDQTAERAAATALRENEQRFRLLYEQSPVAYQSLDADGRILEVNDAWLTELGYAREEAIGRWFGDFLAGDGSALFPARFAEFKARGEVHDVEWTLRHKDGSETEVLLRGHTGRGTAGEFSRSYCVFVNITERKRAETALRASETRFRELFDNISSGVVVYEAVEDGQDFVIRDFNYAAQQIERISKQEILNHRVTEVFPGVRDMGLLEVFQRVWRTGQPENCNATIYHDERITGWRENRVYRLPSGELVAVYEDITERKREEEALAAERSLLRTLVDHLPVAVYVKDAACRKTLANPVDIRSMGAASEAEVLGKTDFDVYPKDLAAAFYADDLRVIQTGQPVLDHEEAVFHPDGTRGWTLTSKVPLRDSAGQIIGLVGIGHDITESKRAAELVAQQRDLLNGLLENIPVGIAVLGPSGEIMRVNQGCTLITGYTLEEIASLAEGLLCVFPDPAYRQIVLAHWQEALQGDAAAVTQENKIVARDGAVKDIEFRSVRLSDGRVLASLIDVSERRRSEEALRASEARLQIAKAAAGLGIYDHDVASGMIRCDQRARELWGVGPDEPITYDVFMAGLHPDDCVVTQAVLDRALDPAGAGRYDAEYRVISRSDRRERWVAATGHVFFEADRAVRVVGTVQDISERKRAEDELRDTVAELQRSNADLERFAYVASHDLQEPLRMVTSFVQLLGERYRGQLDADADEFIGFAVDGARRMQQLILDLLEYSRVGSRGNPLRPTDVAVALDDALRDLKLALQDAGATVTWDPLPTIMADATQLTQVFQNLIGNAIKFRGSEPPEMHISAQREANHWLFRVRDNGIGIDPQYFDRIFVIFQRLHTREAYPGTGVGLAICQRIIERHGGRIWVESAPDQGATFCFTLPA